MCTENLLTRKHTRREALIKAAAATLAATGLNTPGVIFAQNQLTLTPGETAGPYWLDGMPNRSDIRGNSTGGAIQQGFPMKLAINVSRLANNSVTAVNGEKVDIWHCNALGKYSGVAQLGTQGQNFLRGYQLSNASGNVSFTNIYPGWYRGRTVHIHFRVRLYSGTRVTYNFVSQLYCSDVITNQVYTTAPYNTRPNRDTTNATDMVFTGGSQGTGGQVSSNSGQYLLLKLTNSSGLANASFNVVL